MTAPTLLLDTAEEVARWLRVSPHTIRSWARRGHITRHPGDRYNAVEAADYLDQRTTADNARARHVAKPRSHCVS